MRLGSRVPLPPVTVIPTGVWLSLRPCASSVCVWAGSAPPPPSPDPRPGLSFGSGDHTGGLDGRHAVSFEGNVEMPHPSFARLPIRSSPHACLHTREHHTLVWGPSDENKTWHRLEKKASDFMGQFGKISETELLRDGI